MPNRTSRVGRTARGAALSVAALIGVPALAGSAWAQDSDISIYFVGCAAPTGFHGYLARGAEEAGKNLGVNVTYIYPDQLTIPNQIQKIEEAIDGVEGIKDYYSVAAEGYANLTVEVHENHSLDKVKERLEPRVRELGLQNHVAFSGYVSEDEKLRLLKCSRLFLMPSRYESWGIVIGEALACGVPVLGYRLDCYPAVFGELVCYVPCFDARRYQDEAVKLVNDLRAGRNYLEPDRLKQFKGENSWAAAQQKFCAAVAALDHLQP